MAAAENNHFSKNVILLRLEDCQRSNGSVLIPNTIEMARIRRPDTGQYRPNVQFSTNMSEQIVQQTLQNSFPTFDLNEGFSCAGINNQSNAFNFHGDRRIWDGSTIRRNLRGNSVLYIVMSEPTYDYQYWTQWLRDNVHYEATITPAQSPLQGGDPFKVTFTPALEQTVTSGFAKFKKTDNVFATVELERSARFGYLHGSSIPAAPEPGLADVEIESQGRILLGSTRIFYYPNERQTIAMVHFEESSMFRRLCEDMSENFRGANSTSTGRPQTSATFGHAQQVQLLCFLVYTAAKEGAQHFVEMIFSCSAGRIVFDAYKSNSQLPEVIAREHGNLGIARYFENITERLLKESSTGKECPKAIDWSELAKATDKTQQQLVKEDIQTTSGAFEKKWDTMVENQKDTKSLLEHFSEHEMELDGKDLAEIQKEMMEMSSEFLKTANSLRAAAAKLEQVLKGCQMTRIAGTSAVLGGMLIIGGGIFMSLGAAAPILATGIGVALCGTTAEFGADIYEKVKNLIEIKKAEKLLRKLLMVIDEIGQSKLGRKKEKNLSYLHYLAQTHELNDPIREMLSGPFEFKRKQAMNTKEDTRHAPKVFVPIGTQVPPKSNFNARSSKAASKAEGKSSVEVPLDVKKIIWDTEVLGSTIRAVIEIKGFNAPKVLREKAGELEKLALLNDIIMNARKSDKSA
nr:uncharacterized protein LOC131783719 isoform X2 [Pocillopora verrucosa]